MPKPKEIPNELILFFMKHGKQYTPALLPADIKRGAVGTCFDTSAVNALDRKYRYVEGIAMSPRSYDWILHAWLTDGERAYDPTWRALNAQGEEVPVPSAYVGVELEIEAVAGFMLSTEYASVLANAWRDPEQARAILPTKCPILKGL